MAALANPKHEAVLQAYIVDPERIGWRAYKAVYPNSSQHAAETAWSRLLKSAEFAARLDELNGKAVDGAVMTAQEVLLELSHLGRSNAQDLAHLLVSDTVVADVGALTRAEAAAIAELTVETFQDGAGDDAREVKRVRFKLHSKTTALDLLGKHHKLFVERRVIEDPDGRGAGVAAAEVLSDLEFARRLNFVLERAARKPEPSPQAKPKKE